MECKMLLFQPAFSFYIATEKAEGRQVSAGVGRRHASRSLRWPLLPHYLRAQCLDLKRCLSPFTSNHAAWPAEFYQRFAFDFAFHQHYTFSVQKWWSSISWKIFLGLVFFLNPCISHHIIHLAEVFPFLRKVYCVKILRNILLVLQRK